MCEKCDTLILSFPLIHPGQIEHIYPIAWSKQLGILPINANLVKNVLESISYTQTVAYDYHNIFYKPKSCMTWNCVEGVKTTPMEHESTWYMDKVKALNAINIKSHFNGHFFTKTFLDIYRIMYLKHVWFTHLFTPCCPLAYTYHMMLILCRHDVA